LDPNGHLLIQSDGQSAAGPGGQVTQDLLAGTYLVEVTGLGSGTGTYTLTTAFQQATPPDQPLDVNFNHASPWTLPPGSVGTGAFNGDGHLDFATADYATDSVSVRLGLGDGTFQSATYYTTGPGPFGIVTGDFNEDGHLDLAVINSGSNSNDFSILLGKGDGTFQPEKRYIAGTAPESLVAADLNGDGYLDLVIVDHSGQVVNHSGQVSVLLGNGDGTFLPEQRYAVGDAPKYVAVGD